METRSAKRRSRGPVAVVSEKSPSRRLQPKKSCDQTFCRSILEDSGISTDAPKESSTKSRAINQKISTLDDTPKHLYGLDKEEVSSGDESTVDPKIPIQGNVGDKRSYKLQYAVGLCVVCAILILVGLTGFAMQNSQNHDTLVQKNEEVKGSQDSTAALTDSFMKLQDELEVLSSKVNRLLAQDTVPRQDEELKRTDPSISNEHLKNIIEDLVKEKVEAALDTYSADKLGIPDFALESAGGQIMEPYHSVSFSKDAPVISFFGIPLYYNVNSPRVIIQPDNTAGNCWAFEGHKGFVTIKLSKRITITAFTIEHIPAALSSTGDGRIPSAPKDFSVWGLRDVQGKHQKCIGQYTYDSKGKPLQTFPTKMTESTFKYVQLRIHSNHGNPKYTCIYRFRVHGEISMGWSGTKSQNTDNNECQDKGL